MRYKCTKKIAVFFLLHIGIFSFAQFNTITRHNPKQEKEQTEKEYQQRIFLGKEKPPMQEKESKQEKSKKKNRLFGGTSKAELKKQNDSLKSFIKEIKENLNAPKKTSEQEKKNIDYKKIEDSIIYMMQKNFGQRGNAPKKMQTFELIKDFPTERNHSIGMLHMPLKKITITSPFGTRTHPIFGGKKMHYGVDFRANYENVYAVLDGVVVESGWDSKGGGNYIKIRHGDRFETSYSHLSKIYYKKGERVRGGYIIAKSGNSGNSTGPHLHFAVREYGKFINPIPFLNSLIKTNNLIALYNGK